MASSPSNNDIIVQTGQRKQGRSNDSQSELCSCATERTVASCCLCAPWTERGIKSDCLCSLIWNCFDTVSVCFRVQWKELFKLIVKPRPQRIFILKFVFFKFNYWDYLHYVVTMEGIGFFQCRQFDISYGKRPTVVNDNIECPLSWRSVSSSMKNQDQN